MSHLRIPKDWKVQRSTPFFTKGSVPPALLTHHNTAEGVFGQLCVMEGQVTYYGFADEFETEPEMVVVINAGQFATSPPQYWHRIEICLLICHQLTFQQKTCSSLFVAYM